MVGLIIYMIPSTPNDVVHPCSMICYIPMYPQPWLGQTQQSDTHKHASWDQFLARRLWSNDLVLCKFKIWYPRYALAIDHCC